MEKETVKPSAFLLQLLATCTIAYLTSLCGFVYAWPSYTLSNFVSNETVLSRPMTTTEISILGSITNLGALFTIPFCQYAIDNIGRKYSAILFGLPYVLAWSIISVTTSVPVVLCSMGIAGIGAAGQAVSSVYISEICYDSIRGMLTSSTVAGFFLGLMCSFVFGGQLSYYQVLYVHLALSILYMILLMLLEESPVFLVQCGKEAGAAKSVAFYRRVPSDSKEVELVISKIKLQLDPKIDEILQEGTELDHQVRKELIADKSEENRNQTYKISPWKFLKNSKSSQHALATVLILMAASILMGAIVLQVYAEPLFKEAAPSLSSNMCAIFLALDFLIASLICASLVDRFGRKFLLTYSSLAAGLFCIILAAQLQMRFAAPWVTVLLIYAYCFIYNLGAATVPFIMTAEVFLPEVRGLGNSMTMGCMWIINFVTLIIFNPLVEIFGLGPLFYGFGFVCFLTAVYSHYLVPETKGLSADAIQQLFLKRVKKSAV